MLGLSGIIRCWAAASDTNYVAQPPGDCGGALETDSSTTGRGLEKDISSQGAGRPVGRSGNGLDLVEESS